MTRTIWRARCEHGEVRRNVEPAPSGHPCGWCSLLVPWQRWEVTERVGYIAETFGFAGLDRPESWRWHDENGNRCDYEEQRRGCVSKGHARPFLHPTRESAEKELARWNWIKRVRPVTTRTLRRVKP